jgi:ubiquitin carboxyl-terminal hydrolase 14
VLDWATDDLKAKLLPIGVRLKEIEKSRAERRNVRKKTKSAVSHGAPALTGSAPLASPMVAAGGATDDVTMSDDADTGLVVAPESTNVVVHSETIEDEASVRQREAAELFDLLPDDLKADVGANYSGLYELVGEGFEIRQSMVAQSVPRHHWSSRIECGWRTLYWLRKARRL